MTVRPQPNGGFVWVQAAAGPALVCRALRPFALHIFTTRAWRLGSAGSGADDGWTDVSAALDVEPIDLARLHQVHGSTVVVAAPGGTAHRPSADIVITDDAAKAVAVQTADCVPL